MTRQAGERAAVAVAVQLAMGACLALVGVAVFSDGLTLRAGSRALELDSLRPPLYALALLGILLAALRRDAVLPVLRRLLAGAPSAADRRLCGAFLALLVGVGLLLRIARIHEYGLNADEAQFVWFAAAESLGDVWRYDRAASPHPPGNFFLLHLLLGISRDPFWLRLPAVLAGTFAIWMSHRLTRQLFGEAAGLAAALLVAFAPALVELSRVCRNYAPGFALLLVAVYFFVRFLRSEEWRHFAVFSAVAPVAVAFHYGFAAAFAGLEAVLAGVLLARRRPVGWWGRAALYQLPFAALLLFLYLAHVARIELLVDHHQDIYRRMLGFSPGALLHPVAEVWRYLTGEPLATVFLGLSLLGAAVLLLEKRFLGLGLCVAPLAAAYALRAAGVLPLGATRHSAYLFPFLFALVASQVPAALEGYRGARGALRRILARLRPGRAAPDAAARSPRSLGPVLGLAATLALGAFFLDAALGEYDREASYVSDLAEQRSRELLPYYRRDDLERAFALLEERAGERDIVLVGFQGLFALRMHLGLSPILDPTPEDWAAGNIRIALPGPECLRHVHNGVRYFYARRVTVHPGPETLLRGLDDVMERFGIPRPERIWTLRSGWEVPHGLVFAIMAPEVPFDRQVVAESNGMLLAVEASALEAVRGREMRAPALDYKPTD